jgi:hypothetical protein
LGEFNDRVNRLIKGLRSLCLPGDLVSIYAGNCRAYYEIIGRGWTRRHPLRAGPLAFHAEELAYVIDNSERRRRPVCGPDLRPQPYGHRLRISQGAQQDRSGAPRTRCVHDDRRGVDRPRPQATKAPRSIDFVATLPRHETGKLYNRLLRDKYWEGTGRKI